MIRRPTSVLSASTAQHLAAQQAKIDHLPGAGQPAKAQALWNGKSGKKNRKGEAAFAEVKQALAVMCACADLCHYCEHNEGTDIEHIYPKSFFPGRTFQWSNYLWSCGKCNSRCKLDQFAVFASAQSATVVELASGQSIPPFDTAFIDPTVEDPMQYLWLDIQSGSFVFAVDQTLIDPRAIAKAAYTLRVLQIGSRALLINARRHAFQFFRAMLERYRAVSAATSFEDLRKLTRYPEEIDTDEPLKSERDTILKGIKTAIQEHQHPTVWREMQRQRHALALAELFAQTDALNW